jgi:hypothetical protein
MSDETELGRVSAGIGLVRLIIVFAATLAGFWAASSVEQCGSRGLSMAIVAVLAALAVYGAIVRVMHLKVLIIIVFIIFGALFAVAGWSSSLAGQCLPGF